MPTAGRAVVWPAGRWGYALLAVLWVMTGVAALILTLSLGARGALTTARNRMELIRAAWRAEDCVERARAVIGEALRTPFLDRWRDPRYWLRLDTLIGGSPVVRTCPGTVAVVPSGTAVDVNVASGDQLRRFFAALGVRPSRADSLADALLDWRDRDDIARPHGAERDWYELQGRSPPRNGPFAARGELSWVRWFDVEGESVGPDSLLALLTVETGRIVLDLAPIPVVASLPGITEEAVARLEERRVRGAEPLDELIALGAELSPASRDSLLRYFAELSVLTTPEPEAWIVTARAHAHDAVAGSDDVTAEVEVRLVRAGSRVAIVRRRTRP